MTKIYLHTLLILVIASTLGFAQQSSGDMSNEVVTILKKSQDAYGSLKSYSLKTNYKSYGSYKDTEVLQEYSGITIKKGEQMYLGISNTIFLSSSSKTLKIYGNEKVIEVANGSDKSLLDKNPVFLENLLKHYKYKDLKEDNNFYICTLQTASITQMPYGKIVIYINKKDYSIKKQVMYMLAKLPYISNKTGKKKVGNPRIEIELSNFKKTITDKEDKMMRLSKYIKINGSKISTTEAYKDFTIETIK